MQKSCILPAFSCFGDKYIGYAWRVGSVFENKRVSLHREDQSGGVVMVNLHRTDFLASFATSTREHIWKCSATRIGIDQLEQPVPHTYTHILDCYC